MCWLTDSWIGLLGWTPAGLGLCCDHEQTSASGVQLHAVWRRISRALSAEHLWLFWKVSHFTQIPLSLSVNLFNSLKNFTNFTSETLLSQGDPQGSLFCPFTFYISPLKLNICIDYSSEDRYISVQEVTPDCLSHCDVTLKGKSLHSSEKVKSASGLQWKGS